MQGRIRSKRLSNIVKVLLIIVIVAAVLVIREIYRELHTFQVTEYAVEVPEKKGLIKDQRVVFLSDMHNHVYGGDNEALLQEVRDAEPSLILVGGDMLVGKEGRSYENALDFVSKLVDVCPVYYANGNHEQRMKEKPDEYREPSYRDYRAMLQRSGVHFLENETAQISLGGMPVKITGLEIPRKCYTKFRKVPLKTDEIEKLAGAADPSVYQILLAHNPAYVKEYKEWGADLILSGHLHGGMVRLPVLGGVVAPNFMFFPKYSGDIYRDEEATVVVSKGLGTHTINVRLFNPAEVVVLHFTCAK